MRPHQLYYSISITYIFKYFNSFFKKFYKYPYFFNSSYQIPEKLYLFTILKGVSRILCKLIDKSSKFSTLITIYQNLHVLQNPPLLDIFSYFKYSIYKKISAHSSFLFFTSKFPVHTSQKLTKFFLHHLS